MNRFRFAAAVALFAAAPLFAQAPAKEIWVVDKPHSTVTFKVRHLMSFVPGQFHDFDATVAIDRNDPARSSVDFSIQAKSIDTGTADRDEHLRSADFFEASKYPMITFKSDKVTPKSKTSYDVTGDLTMHGVTKRITVPVEFLGFGKDPRGIEKAGFDIELALDRKEYEISWNQVLDEGGLLLGDEVKISISLELLKKQ